MGQALLFEDNENIIIEGIAELGSTDSGYYLARFIEEINNGKGTVSNFKTEVEAIKANSAANIAITGFVTFYDTMIDLVVTTSIIFS